MIVTWPWWPCKSEKTPLTNIYTCSSAHLHAPLRTLCRHPQIIAALQCQNKLALGQAGHTLRQVPKQLRAQAHASQRVADHRVKPRAYNDQVRGICCYDRLQHLVGPLSYCQNFHVR